MQRRRRMMFAGRTLNFMEPPCVGTYSASIGCSASVAEIPSFARYVSPTSATSQNQDFRDRGTAFKVDVRLLRCEGSRSVRPAVPETRNAHIQERYAGGRMGPNQPVLR